MLKKPSISTILVIGENAKDIIAKYDIATKVEPYIKFHYDNMVQYKEKELQLTKALMESKEMNLSDVQRQELEEHYKALQEMDDYEFFISKTSGCTYDENTHDAYSTENPFAHYAYARCPQSVLEIRNEESDFSNPFTLKDGTIAYVAKKGDVDWSQMHLHNTHTYERVWEMCVEDSKPTNEPEEKLFKQMHNRKMYFKNFDSKEQYVQHCCSFWCYGLATEDKYSSIDEAHSDKQWVSEFYDKYIKELPDDTLLSIYEAKPI